MRSFYISHPTNWQELVQGSLLLCILLTAFALFPTSFFLEVCDVLWASHTLQEKDLQNFFLHEKNGILQLHFPGLLIDLFYCLLCKCLKTFVRQSIVIDSGETKHRFFLFSVFSHVVALVKGTKQPVRLFFFFPSNSRIPVLLVYVQLYKITGSNFQFWPSWLKKIFQRLKETACDLNGIHIGHISHSPVDGVPATLCLPHYYFDVCSSAMWNYLAWL